MGHRNAIPHPSPCKGRPLTLAMCFAARGAEGAFIFVTTHQQGIGTGACSLQEAIYSSTYANNVAVASIDSGGNDQFVATQCIAGTGNDTIVLPTGGVLYMSKILDDAHNP